MAKVDYKVQITMDAKQCYIMRNALENYARLLMGQFDMVFDNYRFQDNRKADWWEDVNPKLKELKEILVNDESFKYFAEEREISWELMQVLRYTQSWEDFPEGGWTVNFDKPLNLSSRPLAEAKIIKPTKPTKPTRTKAKK